MIKFLGVRFQAGSSTQTGKANLPTSLGGYITFLPTEVKFEHSYVTVGPEFLVHLGNEGVFSLNAGYGSSRGSGQAVGIGSERANGRVVSLGASVRFYLHNRVAFMPSIQYLTHTYSGIGSVEMINVNAGIAINFERFK